MYTLSILKKKSLNTKINLLDLNYIEMKKLCLSIGEKSFHTTQLMEWIYHKYCVNFDRMTNLSVTLRQKLKSISSIIPSVFTHENKSLDGTIKWSVLTTNNQLIETVYIPEKKRGTLCISSQIGCVLNCDFCSTGKQGFNRNLSVAEIIGQVWSAMKRINFDNLYCSSKITNIVLMGMGEPLLNFANIVSAIQIMLDSYGFNFSKRHITLSTVGIVPALNKLSNFVDINLALSLHASNDIIRSKIMPINNKYNIRSCLNSAFNYIKKSTANHNGVTIEYVMLNRINDYTYHAVELARLLKYIPSKINLIPWNPFINSKFVTSSSRRILKFYNTLISYGVLTFIRKNRGNDINAACGQLIGKISNRMKNIN